MIYFVCIALFLSIALNIVFWANIKDKEKVLMLLRVTILRLQQTILRLQQLERNK